MRTISSPGVQIIERDLSLGPVFPVGTNVFVTGFTSKGPADEVLQITSTTEFENVFGIPTTPAERYLYYTASSILDNSNGNLYINRLPYGQDLGSGYGTTYGALVYPSAVYNPTSNAFTNNYTLSNAVYFVGEPKFFELTLQEYLSVLDGSAFNWSTTNTATTSAGTAYTEISTIADFGKAAIVVLNKAQTTTNNKFEGYYVGIADNTNLLPSTNFDSILKIKSIQNTTGNTGTTSYTEIPSTRLAFALSTEYANPGDSVSQILENIPVFDTFSSTYDDTISLGLFKVRQSPFANDVTSLGFVFEGGYNASLDYYRQINSQFSNVPQSYFLGKVASEGSNVTVMVNDNISNRRGTTWLDDSGEPTKKVRILTNSIKNQLTSSEATLSGNVGVTLSVYNSAISYVKTVDSLYPVGPYVYDAGLTDKNLGNIPLKIDRVLKRVENDEIYDIDIILDSGLSTIYTSMCANQTTYFDDTQISDRFRDGLTALTKTQSYDPPTNPISDVRAHYLTIFNKFQQFAEFSRKDCIFISDPLRHIFIRGENTKVMSNPDNAFSMAMYNPLRHLYETTNTSYVAAYANWGKVRDIFTGIDTWIPFSGVAATNMAVMDETFYPWYAPAGFTRGRVSGLIDLAISPKQKDRDQLYKIGMNPVTLVPGEGYVIFGQKTLLSQPSVFNRINVRRLFLYLEKAAKRTAKYFVFEPNTYITRTRFVNTLTPIFEKAQNNEGVLEFLIVCDSRNNTPTVIDENELVADIYIKPVHASEFVLVNFYATRTATNFNELVGNP